MRIGIKIGSALLTSNKGDINDRFILEICRQVAELVHDGHEIFIVSSGAVASDPKKNRSKNLRAGVGQPRLMNRYNKFFEIFNIEVSQHLLTDENVLGKYRHRTKQTLLEALEEKIVPIINGNDVVDDKELKALEKCADNDILFKSVCFLLKTDLAIIGFAEKGLLSNRSKIVRQVRPDEIGTIMRYAKKGSKLGHGENGMSTKIGVLGELAKKGIVAILAPGREKDFILRAKEREINFGTIFNP